MDLGSLEPAAIRLTLGVRLYFRGKICYNQNTLIEQSTILRTLIIKTFLNYSSYKEQRLCSVHAENEPLLLDSCTDLIIVPNFLSYHLCRSYKIVYLQCINHMSFIRGVLT